MASHNSVSALEHEALPVPSDRVLLTPTLPAAPTSVGPKYGRITKDAAKLSVLAIVLSGSLTFLDLSHLDPFSDE